MEKLSGIKQPMIARIEKQDSIPELDTFLKLLNSLGMTIKVVPLESEAISKV